MIEILRPGLLTTVQDLGRPGLRAQGVPAAGALDVPALTAGNCLVGNAPDAAGLEVTFGKLHLRLLCDTWIALTGADCEARLDGRAIHPGWAEPATAGSVLELGEPRHGMRSYLALAGGIQVPQVLGARATDLGGNFGGHRGRALRRGDRLPLGTAVPGLRRAGIHLLAPRSLLRFLPGPEWGELSESARERFQQIGWRVSPQSNRMGYRLEGPSLPPRRAAELPSHAVCPGLIQMPPDGHPIVLLADAQTTGGYARLGVVIRADLGRLAQARLGQALHFIPVDMSEARRAEAALRRYLAAVRRNLDEFRAAH